MMGDCRDQEVTCSQQPARHRGKTAYFLLPLISFVSFVVERSGFSFLGFAKSQELGASSCNSSRWIFHPLDDPYRVFVNNDAGSSGIAENMTKFFHDVYASNSLHIRPLKGHFRDRFFRFS